MFGTQVTSTFTNSHFTPLLGCLWATLLAVGLASPSAYSQESDDETGACSDGNAALQFRQGEVQVSPVDTTEDQSNSDTDNLQCAINEAGRLGISTVRLVVPEGVDGPAVFNIGAVVLNQFEGALLGSGRDNTILKVSPNGLDCSAALESGRYPAVIKVIGGNARIAQLAVETDAVCEGGNQNFAVIHFTGESTSDECSDAGSTTGVISGLVERTSMTSLAFDNAGSPIYEGTGILAAAEGAMLKNSCDDKQLGSLRVVRNDIEGFFAGVQTRMQGGAQVDINFNNFTDTPTALAVFNANQVLNLQGNSIKFDDPSVLSYSVWIDRLQTESGDAIPSTNRVVVYNNSFDLNAAANSMAVRAASPDSAAVVDLELSVSGNEFVTQGAESDVLGVYLLDLSFANVSRNRFVGGPASSIPAAVFVDSADEPARRSTISYNNFANYVGPRGIVFTPGTSNNTVGPLQIQDAVISDAGENIILE